VRIASVVMSPNDIRDRSLVSAPAMRVAIASKSWR
jgi:nitrous oxidase accessory protein NosD